MTMTSPAIQCSFICIATSVIKCLQRHIVRNIPIRCENSNVFPFLFWQKNWWVQFLLLIITSKFFAMLVDQGKKRRGSEGDTLHWQREANTKTKYKYNEMKHGIFVFFSLLLDLANQDLRGKEEDLNETDKRESHTKTEHSSDVGDERNWRHHL